MSNTQTRQKDDFYPTPPEATEALLDNERFDSVVWEPAAGDGAIAEVMTKHGYNVVASDLNDYGYCKAGTDFLMETRLPEVHRPVTSLVTNPPYKLAEQFIQHAIRLGAIKHAWLLRLSFLEGVKRRTTLFEPHPPSRVHIFSSRLTIWRGDEVRAGNGTTAYAWFVWDKPVGSLKLKPRINWL